MSGQHTPGPWFVDGVGRNAMVRSKDYTIVAVRHREDGDTHEANARLIAAAPDLLASLERIDAFWTEECPGGPDKPDMWGGLAKLTDDTVDIWRSIRAAIAKATGAL